MIVMWRAKAAEDFEAVIALAGESSASEASERKATIESKILLLERFKDFGRKTRRAGVRELALDTVPIVIVFRVSDGVILVLRMFGIEPKRASAVQGRA